MCGNKVSIVSSLRLPELLRNPELIWSTRMWAWAMRQSIHPHSHLQPDTMDALRNSTVLGGLQFTNDKSYQTGLHLLCKVCSQSLEHMQTQIPTFLLLTYHPGSDGPEIFQRPRGMFLTGMRLNIPVKCVLLHSLLKVVHWASRMLGKWWGYPWLWDKSYPTHATLLDLKQGLTM